MELEGLEPDDPTRSASRRAQEPKVPTSGILAIRNPREGISRSADRMEPGGLEPLTSRPASQRPVHQQGQGRVPRGTVGSQLQGFSRSGIPTRGFLICGTWPREESNLRAWIRSPPLYPLSYGAVLGCTVSCAAHVVAVAQLVEPRVVIPVVAGSSPVRHLFLSADLESPSGDSRPRESLKGPARGPVLFRGPLLLANRPMPPWPKDPQIFVRRPGIPEWGFQTARIPEGARPRARSLPRASTVRESADVAPAVTPPFSEKACEP